MQVGTDHCVDPIAGPTGLTKPLKEFGGQRLAAVQASWTVVANAGVDHQPQTRRLYQEGMDREPQMALFGDVVRIEPGVLPQSLRRCVRQKRTTGAVGHRQFNLNDPGDFDIADLPAEHDVFLLAQ